MRLHTTLNYESTNSCYTYFCFLGLYTCQPLTMGCSFVNIELSFLHDVIRPNLDKKPKECIDLAYTAIYQRYSLDLIRSPRLETSMKTYLFKGKGFVNRIRKSLKGGKQRVKHAAWLGTSPVWQMKIMNEEFVKTSLMSKIDQLQSENIKLSSVKGKNKRLSAENKRLKQIVAKHRNRATRLSILLRNRETGNRRMEWRRKLTYSQRHVQRLRSKLKEECQDRLQFMNLLGVEVKSMWIKDKKTKNVECINFVEDEDLQEISDSSQDELLERLNLSILVKDAHGVSDATWKSLCCIPGNNLPNLNQVKN